MNKLLLASIIFAVAVVSPADGKKKTEINCAVMGFKIDMAEAAKTKMFADYKGRRYFFCCSGCPETFKANPAKYAKAESIPTPKPVKKPKKKTP
ncbi:MAG: hypothetical protein QOJ65_576 [Fimbriimonadaceae bacterium]|nr:hypothetical protein [Fimbriimonadaceae bacterium]